jgi:hypothetical protein
MTADKKRNIPEREVTWTTKPPKAPAKTAPENLMRRPMKISREAEAAQTNK